LFSDIAVSPLYLAGGDSENCVAAPSSAGNVRIIAGEFKGVKGPAMTFSPIDVWDISILDAAGEYEFGEWRLRLLEGVAGRRKRRPRK